MPHLCVELGYGVPDLLVQTSVGHPLVHSLHAGSEHGSPPGILAELLQQGGGHNVHAHWWHEGQTTPEKTPQRGPARACWYNACRGLGRTQDLQLQRTSVRMTVHPHTVHGLWGTAALTFCHNLTLLNAEFDQLDASSS